MSSKIALLDINAIYTGNDPGLIDMAGGTAVSCLVDDHVHVTRAVERWQAEVRFGI